MQEHNTLVNTWVGMVHGYPVRVEEHWNNLSYIVEFYELSDEGSGRCITHNPVTGQELKVEEVDQVGFTTA